MFPARSTEPTDRKPGPAANAAGAGTKEAVMTRSLKAAALAAIVTLGAAIAIAQPAAATGAPTGAYMVARAQTGGEIIDNDGSTGPVSGVYH